MTKKDKKVKTFLALLVGNFLGIISSFYNLFIKTSTDIKIGITTSDVVYVLVFAFCLTCFIACVIELIKLDNIPIKYKLVSDLDGNDESELGDFATDKDALIAALEMVGYHIAEVIENE